MPEEKKYSPVIISFLQLRRVIGIIGILLPGILILGTFTIGGCTQVQESISHYYYTVMRDVLVGALCAIAIFLISYYGYERIDNITTSLAGVFTLVVAFFPTTQNQDPVCTVYYLEPNIWRVYIHYGAAVLLFASLAFISMFLFTRGEKIKGKRKKVRNFIYVTCGVIILLAVILIVIIRTVPSVENRLEAYNPVFWIEWAGLIAFGISWLIKGKVLFDDIVDND